jgi:hypothetical protein
MSLLTLTSLALIIMPTRRSAQGSPCLTNADTAARYINQVTTALTGGDSTRLVQQGLPYRPSGGISLVTDSATCAAVVNAYNSTSPDSTTMVTRAYVLRVGNSNYATVGENKPGVFVYFDNTYHWLAGLVSM